MFHDTAPAMTFQVDKTDLSTCKTIQEPAPHADNLKAGEVLVSVDQFAFTANNVTYAIAGDQIGYWQFFPAPAPWGVIPVWGFGTVRHTACEDVAEGERLYGYFPMGTHVTLRPGAAGTQGLVDTAAHRAQLPPVYNQYVRLGTDAPQDPVEDAAQMLYRPLFMTSYLIDDFLEDEGFFGAKSVLLLSASSKTAIGTAHMLSRRAGHPVEVVGLTSPGNADFVKSLGCYDRVVTYDAVPDGLPQGPVAIVDMAGNKPLLDQLHRHYKDDVKHSSMVGVTHGEMQAPAADMPGPAPTFFFAPDRIVKRSNEWGPGGLQERFAPAWDSFVTSASGWIDVVRGFGPGPVEQVYRDMLDGKASPDKGHVLSLWSGS